MNHSRTYDAKLDNLMKTHKNDMEKAESSQSNELRLHQRKMKAEQVFIFKLFQKLQIIVYLLATSRWWDDSTVLFLYGKVFLFKS